MIDLERLGDKLERSLKDVLIEPSVKAVKNDRLKAFLFVVSKSFEKMDDGRRQSKVWDRVLHTLDQDEQDQIEFIFTDAPSEIER